MHRVRNRPVEPCIVRLFDFREFYRCLPQIRYPMLVGKPVWWQCSILKSKSCMKYDDVADVIQRMIVGEHAWNRRVAMSKSCRSSVKPVGTSTRFVCPCKYSNGAFMKCRVPVMHLVPTKTADMYVRG